MGTVYHTPPLVEALCEFHFEPDTPWDDTIPGLLYHELRADFPEREQVQRLQLTVTATENVINPQFAQMSQVRLLNSERTSLIQIAPYLLTVNRLQPYAGWDAFVAIVQRGYAAYRDIAQPLHLRGIIVRYLNQFTFAATPLALETYFNFYPYTGDNFPTMSGFAASAQFAFADARDMLLVQMRPLAEQQPQHVAIQLELSYFLNAPRAVALDDALDWVTQAHQHIEDIFEACITGQLRERFA